MTIMDGRDRRADRRSFALYVAWQAPGWVVAGAVLLWLGQVIGIATWVVALALALYVGKDLALYPAMRAVFKTAEPTRPIGRRAEAVERLAPSGYVRVNGELWKARARGGEVRAGDEVVVCAAEGLTLIVEKAVASAAGSAEQL